MRFIFRVVSLSLLLASCGGGGGSDSPAGVVVTPVAPVAGIELLAGGLGGFGNRDASGTDSRFNQPYGLAVAADGTRYVADNFNHTVRKISPAGEVTTLAGKAGEAGFADGAGAAARFSSPGGIAVAPDGTVYVTDTGNYTLRAISPAGVVSTLAGVVGSPGAVNGTGATARIGMGTGMVVASDGSIYFCEVDNRLVRKVTPAGEVSSVAGLAGVPGLEDGTGTDAHFMQPVGIAVDGNDILYVADAGAHAIRRVTTGGVVTTWVGGGGSGISGLVNANGSAARFNTPFGVVAETDGTLYVADTQNGVVRKVTPAAEVTTLASLANVPVAGVATPLPTGIGRDASGLLSVTDVANHRMLTVTAAGVVAPAFGAAPLPGATDATGAAARFSSPRALAVASDGKVYVADAGNHVIRVVGSDGAVTTLAGSAGNYGAANGTGAAARFNSPSGIVVDDAGTAYVADTGNHLIRKVTAAGVVTTLAGGAGLSGAVDDTGTAARFNQPAGLALDTAGYLYVADSGNHTIRKISPAGVVTTLAGKAGTAGAVNGTGTTARFTQPAAVAVALDGTVFVADQLNHAIRRVTAAGVVTTFAGSFGQAGDGNGAATTARFSFPAGLGLDGSGTLYVADLGNHLVRTVSAAGDVATLAGVAGASGAVLGALPGGLNLPQGLAPGFDGRLYVTTENSVVKVTPDTPISLFDVGLSASASALVVGQSLTLSWGSRDATNCQASGDWTGAQAASGSTTLTPAAVGTFTYSLTCDENGGTGVKTVSSSVTVSPPLPTLSLTASSAYVAPGDPLTLTWTSTDATSCTASGSWSGARPTSYSEILTPAPGSQSYTLTCSGPGGSIARTVTVSVAPPPVVTLTTSATSVEVGAPFTLTWTSSNASVCVASGGWSGTRATSGSVQVAQAIVGSVSYTLSCTGGGGTTATAVTVTALAPASGGGTGGAGGGGGGGGALDLWALLALGGLLLGRRERQQ